MFYKSSKFCNKSEIAYWKKNKKRKDKKMNIEEEIEKYEKEIKALGLTKGLNLNTKQLSVVLGCSPSSVELWRKNGLGVEYIAVPCLGKKKITRCLYPIRNIAKWMVSNQIKTA
jgi:hypothetical protein